MRKEDLTDDKYIAIICNGEFNAIRDFKIGELFESFFDDINYNVVREDEKVYVDFTGSALCDNEPCTILMRFSISDDNKSFEINLAKVNKDVLDDEEILDLLDDIAFAGGALLDDEDYCSHCEEEDCAHCMYEQNFEDEENIEDIDDEDNDDDDNEDDNEDDNK